MSTITGIVKAKSKNKFGYGILVDDEWYNSKEEIACEKGDEVKFDNGGKRYVNDLEVVKKGSAGASTSSRSGSSSSKPSGGYSSYNRVFPVPNDDGARSIVRQNSVTNAIALFGHLGITGVLDPVEWILNTARQFEKYSAGDIDAEILETLNNTFEVT